MKTYCKFGSGNISMLSDSMSRTSSITAITFSTCFMAVSVEAKVSSELKAAFEGGRIVLKVIADDLPLYLYL